MRFTRGSLNLDVELSAGPGEVVALVGPNGAGKTTVLDVVAGMLALDEGHVVLDGQPLDDPAHHLFVAPDQRAVGYVFQDRLLFPHLNALDNVAFGPRCLGVGKADARRQAAAWLERVGVDTHAGARPGTLSGGQAQRVALARALACEPRLLLLDEPFSAIDAQARVAVRADLRRHLVAFAGASVLVTHDPVEAMVLADRLVVVEQGRVVQSGPAAEIGRRPRSTYVAELAGLNLHRGRARGGMVELPGGAVVATADGGLEGEAFVAVAPKAVGLFRNRPDGSPRNVWAGRVTSLEPYRDRVRVGVDAPVPLVAEITPAAVAELGLHDGVPVWAAVKATEVDVYPV